MKRFLMAVIACILCSLACEASATKIQLMHDTSNGQDQVTLEGSVNLPHQIKLAGFVDFLTNSDDTKEADTTNYFGRLFVTAPIVDHVNFLVQATDGSMMAPVVMPGLQIYAKSEQGMLAIRLLPCRFDIDKSPDTVQFGTVGLNYQLNLLDNKVFVRGFGDFNVLHADKDLPTFLEIITENQLGLNTTANTALFIEYRYKQFQSIDNYNALAIGLEYRF